MPSDATVPYLDRFLAAAEEAADTRPEVDREMAREVLTEVATMLHNGLVLDDLDAHDAASVVDGLADALIEPDPGAAVRARAAAALGAPDLHDPDGASAAYLTAASIMQI